MEQNEKELIMTIADSYGYAEQSMQCIEECAELIQAINKFRRAANEHKPYEVLQEKVLNIIEEIADVELMLEQMVYLIRVKREDIDAIKKQKINRTISRMNSEPSTK